MFLNPMQAETCTQTGYFATMRFPCESHIRLDHAVKYSESMSHLPSAGCFIFVGATLR